jgi:hypothetical protein
MMLSLFSFLVLCFRSIILVAGAVLTVRIWASWSDRPFIIRHVEDELSFLISTKILSTALLESF